MGEGCGPEGDHGVGEFGESFAVLGQRQGLAEFFADEAFAVDEVERVLLHGRESQQIRLNGHSLANEPAFGLIDSQDCNQLRARERPRIRDELLDIGALAQLPELV